jgi:hypothetical protein
LSLEPFLRERGVLDEVLRLEGEKDPLPLPLPQWLPLATSARRFLARPDPRERAIAGLALARSELPGGREALREALRIERNEEAALHLRACLLALGDDGHDVIVVPAFEGRWPASGAASGPGSPEPVFRASAHDLALCLAWSGKRELLLKVLNGTPAAEGDPAFDDWGFYAQFILEPGAGWLFGADLETLSFSWDAERRRWRCGVAR